MDLKTLGRNIRLTRQSQGLTQENVAADLGCSLNTYTKIERGETNVPFSRLIQIAKYLLLANLSTTKDTVAYKPPVWSSTLKVPPKTKMITIT